MRFGQKMQNTPLGGWVGKMGLSDYHVLQIIDGLQNDVNKINCRIDRLKEILCEVKDNTVCNRIEIVDDVLEYDTNTIKKWIKKCIKGYGSIGPFNSYKEFEEFININAIKNLLQWQLHKKATIPWVLKVAKDVYLCDD